MKKPIFRHSNTVYTVAWILTVPLLINICTGCNLFSFWISWILFVMILILSSVRLVFGFRQKCYKFCWGLIAQLVLGAVVLGFFQLSFNKVIKTPVSNPVTPAVVEITPPEAQHLDSLRGENKRLRQENDSLRRLIKINGIFDTKHRKK